MASAARSYSRRDLVLFFGCVVLALAGRWLPSSLRDPVAGSLRRSVLAPLLTLQRNAELSRRAWISRDERATSRDSIVLRSLQLESERAENQRLRRLLGLGAQLRWGFIPAEVLHVRDSGEEFTVALSAGSRAGVQPFSPVVAPQGIVGMVKTVDPSISIAITSSHPDFRVSAMGADGSAFGIVKAHLGDDRERYLLEMQGVPIRSTLKPGTLIVSSGFGGTFPRGIPVGTVLGELRTSELWARTYLLRPAVTPGDMFNVMVLLPPRGAAGVSGVWATGEGVDSAVKRIAAAGDSLARERAAAVRQAAVRDSLAHDAVIRDSLARDSLLRDSLRRDSLGRQAPP